MRLTAERAAIEALCYHVGRAHADRAALVEVYAPCVMTTDRSDGAGRERSRVGRHAAREGHVVC
jgi:hypothetical protein